MRWRRRADLPVPAPPPEDVPICVQQPQGPPNYKVSTLTINPGDVIVIESPTSMSREAFHALRDKVKANWPDNKVVVLECGMHIHVSEEVEESTNNDTENLHHDSSISPGLDPGDTRGTRATGPDA